MTPRTPPAASPDRTVADMLGAPADQPLGTRIGRLFFGTGIAVTLFGALRQRFDATQLPVVALTAAALTSERDEALAAGMNDFLTKPIDAQRLRDALLRWGRARSAA